MKTMPNETRRHKLNDVQKEFVLRCLACGFYPKDVADFVKDEFDIRIKPSDVSYYQKRYEDRIAELREEIAGDLQKIPLAKKLKRTAFLERLATKLYRQRDYKGCAGVLKQIAEEVGGIVQKHEVTGMGGKDLIPRSDLSHLTDEELGELQEILERADARRDQTGASGA